MCDNLSSDFSNSVTNNYTNKLPTKIFLLSSDSETEVLEVVLLSSDDENDVLATNHNDDIPTENELENAADNNEMGYEPQVVALVNDGKKKKQNQYTNLKLAM